MVFHLNIIALGCGWREATGGDLSLVFLFSLQRTRIDATSPHLLSKERGKKKERGLAPPLFGSHPL
jgi:hypothetical protein